MPYSGSAAIALLFIIPVQAAVSEVLHLARPQEVGMSFQRLSRIDVVVDEAIQEGDVPGAVVLVARQGRIVYRKAFGHRALRPRKEPMTIDTVFDLASLTKVVATTTSVMILVEEGRLTLTDPASLFLPEFSRHGKENITILSLLTHFSGLRAGLDQDEIWSGFEEAVKRASEEQLVAVPGSRFMYSDINYIVLSAVLAEAAGMPLDEFSATRVFSPLGMKHTTFNPPESWKARTAPTEVRNGRMLRGRVHDPTSERMGGVAGHAGLFSTAGDLAVYAQMLLNRGVYNGTRILSPMSVERMTTNQSPAEQDSWRAVGFDIRTRFSSSRGDLFPIGSFGHTGFTGTSLWIDPSSQAFLIILTSRLHPGSHGDVGRLRRQLANIVAASIEDRQLGW